VRRFLSLFLIGAACYGALSHFTASGSSNWQKLDNGLEMRVVTKRQGLSKVSVTAIRAYPSQIHVATGTSQWAKDWVKKTGAKAVINGGYFDEKGKPLGLRIASRNRTNKILTKANWGVFYIRNNRAYITHTRDYQPSKHTQEAMQCGPRLVVKGKTTDLKSQWGRRTGVGIEASGKVILAASDGELSFDDWANIWASKSGLNCRDALNMDGGGSTQMIVRSKNNPVDIKGAWSVPDVIFAR
jgi:exopolysaccharide biosynthesis protein